MHAPTAELDFDAQNGVFHTVRITDPDGGELNATRAVYTEADERIILDGPLDFSAKGFTAHAVSGEVLLSENRVVIHGPVVGHFQPPPK
jgi:hypothetical protein